MAFMLRTARSLICLGTASAVLFWCLGFYPCGLQLECCGNPEAPAAEESAPARSCCGGGEGEGLTQRAIPAKSESEAVSEDPQLCTCDKHPRHLVLVGKLFCLPGVSVKLTPLPELSAPPPRQILSLTTTCRTLPPQRAPPVAPGLSRG